MEEFKESEHPRKKDGKFTTKGNGEHKQNREKELEDKYNTDLPFEPKKALSKQEWALWYKAVAENKALGYWAEELPNGNAILKVENKNNYKIVITGGTFENPKAKAVYSFLSSDEMNDYIEVLMTYDKM